MQTALRVLQRPFEKVAANLVLHFSLVAQLFSCEERRTLLQFQRLRVYLYHEAVSCQEKYKMRHHSSPSPEEITKQATPCDTSHEGAAVSGVPATDPSPTDLNKTCGTRTAQLSVTHNAFMWGFGMARTETRHEAGF